MSLRTQIMNGTAPSVALRGFIADNPGISKPQLALAFTGVFPGVDALAHQIIWNWKVPPRDHGLDDTALDLELRGVLRTAGYLPTAE